MKSIKNKMLLYSRQRFAACIACLVCVSFICMSASAPANVKNQHEPNSWILDKTVSSVECYHQLTTCNGKSAVMLKFNNRSRGSVKITWGEIYTSESGQLKQGYGGRKELILPPGVTAPADCNDVVGKKMITRDSEVDPIMLIDIKDFSFERIVVTPVIRTIRD